MTQSLQEMKDELAEMRVARSRLLRGEQVVSVASDGGTRTQWQGVTLKELDRAIADLESAIARREGRPGGYRSARIKFR